MPLVNFANLDFDQIKLSIQDYLRSSSDFTDYDFEGSNLSVLIDMLAYNTYITSYNANMVSNEVFIDSATLRENVVSLARNIGYTPTSKQASDARVYFEVDTTSLATKPETITLKAGLFGITRTYGNQNYSFNVLDDVTVNVVQDRAIFDDIKVYEGSYIKETFTVDSFNPNQRFILGNPGIDVSTIRVTVKPTENSSVSRKYRHEDSLFSVNGESPVFFISEAPDERYELLFGDGIFGKKLESPNFIEVTYLVTSGKEANELKEMSYTGTIVTTRTNAPIVGGISLVTVDQPAANGKDIESIESIRKFSTRIFAAQNRAVTPSDYEAIIPSLYPETESVSVFGGEELNPPEFGKVFISIKPSNGAYLSNLIKDNIKRDIKQYTVAGITPEIIDLKYLYIEPDVNIYYNTNSAPSGDTIDTIVRENIETFANSTELNQFGARFKYSKFLNLIDNSHRSITSNITTIVMRRDLRAALNTFAEYEICFGNRFYIKNHGHSPASGVGYNIKSSGFRVSGIPGIVYLADMPNMGLETGAVNLIQLQAADQATVVRSNVGTIDYIKGEIKLNPINIVGTELDRGFPLIEISAFPYSNDIIGLQDLYLQLDISNTTTEPISDRIASGNDISGSNYIVSSSYANGSLVRGRVNLRTPTTQITQVTTTPVTSTTSTATPRYSGTTY